MSARYFCDVCETELSSRRPDRVRRRLGEVTVEVMVAHKGVWNGGHLCEPCVLRIINEGEPADEKCSYLAAAS